MTDSAAIRYVMDSDYHVMVPIESEVGKALVADGEIPYVTSVAYDALLAQVEEMDKVVVHDLRVIATLTDDKKQLERDLESANLLLEERERLLTTVATILGVESHWINIDKQAHKLKQQLADAQARKVE